MNLQKFVASLSDEQLKALTDFLGDPNAEDVNDWVNCVNELTEEVWKAMDDRNVILGLDAVTADG